jgi:hypothetical protein
VLVVGEPIKGVAEHIAGGVAPAPSHLVNFYIAKADTPFLLYFVDINRLQVYYNNIIDTLISPITALGSKRVTLPII